MISLVHWLASCLACCYRAIQLQFGFIKGWWPWLSATHLLYLDVFTTRRNLVQQYRSGANEWDTRQGARNFKRSTCEGNGPVHGPSRRQLQLEVTKRPVYSVIMI